MVCRFRELDLTIESDAATEGTHGGGGSKEDMECYSSFQEHEHLNRFRGSRERKLMGKWVTLSYLKNGH